MENRVKGYRPSESLQSAVRALQVVSLMMMATMS